MMEDVNSVNAKPATSKCVYVLKHANVSAEAGDVDPLVEAIALSSFKRPALARNPVYQKLGQSTLTTGPQILLQVLTCSLSSRDVAALSGEAVHLKPRRLPYIPGTYVCGRIVDMDTKVEGFSIGDLVAGVTGRMPMNGLSEYVLLPASRCAVVPMGLDPMIASLAPAMAGPLRAAEFILSNDTVLVLGGGSGIETGLARLRGASKIYTTAPDPGADVVVEGDWTKNSDMMADPVDVILDTLGDDPEAYGKCEYVLKSGYRRGWYLAVNHHGANADRSSWWNNAKSFGFSNVRTPFSAVTPWLPRFKSIDCTRDTLEIEGVLEVLASQQDKGTISPVLHPSSPFPFTEYGIKDAFRLSKNSEQGMVVVAVAQDGL